MAKDIKVLKPHSDFFENEQIGLWKITSLTLPSLPNLQELHLQYSSLTNLVLPDLPNLKEITIERLHSLTNLTWPRELPSLQTFTLDWTSLTNLVLLEGLSSLQRLFINSNSRLTSLTLPEDLSNLESLNIIGNGLFSLTLPAGLSRLKNLTLNEQLLTSLTLPEGLSNLRKLRSRWNQRLRVPYGMNTDNWEVSLGYDLSSFSFETILKHSFVDIEYYNFPKIPKISLKRREDGMEIV